MSSSRKKAIVRKWNQEWVPGYLPAADFQYTDAIELLDLAGKVQCLPPADIKWVCFVRDFNSGELSNPERLLRKTFPGRPRSTGLWIRLRLTDDDVLEGMADNDSTLIQSRGLFLTPPDTRSNTQRIFLPASSIAALEILGLIGVPIRQPVRTPAIPATAEDQPSLFKG